MEAREGTGSHDTRAMGSYELPGRFWELNFDPLKRNNQLDH